MSGAEISQEIFWVPLTECPVCHDEGWVCEDHPGVPCKNSKSCCGGAGMLCPECRRYSHCNGLRLNSSVPDMPHELIAIPLGGSCPLCAAINYAKHLEFRVHCLELQLLPVGWSALPTIDLNALREKANPGSGVAAEAAIRQFEKWDLTSS